MKYIEIKAPAKINIGLNIVEKRTDGFHNLETFFYPINDLYDTLTFELCSGFEFHCDQSELNNVTDNLVVKAIRILEKNAGRILPVKINLTKRIPTGAGLGGGSSDAAATLISLNELFRLNFSNEQLTEFALQLGSDVPFFLKAKPAIGRARGENLTHIDFEIPYHIVLVNSGIHVSTKQAFSEIHPTPSQIDYDEVFQSIDSFRQKKHLIVNDFENYVFLKHPEVKSIKEAFKDLNAEFTLMSGSGSTVYGFFKDENKIEELKRLLPDKYLYIASSPTP